MNLGYRLLYTFGLTPWDHDDTPPELLDIVEGANARPPGRALDLGCGTGADAVALAERGWKVTAVDTVAKALAAARRRAATAGVDVEWINGDVSRLTDAEVTGPFDLVYDIGCFHGLSDADRRRFVDGLTPLTAPDAELLLFAFVPGRRGPAPRGISADEVRRLFSTQWELVKSHAATDVQLSGPLRNADPHWHHLRRLTTPV